MFVCLPMGSSRKTPAHSPGPNFASPEGSGRKILGKNMNKIVYNKHSKIAYKATITKKNERQNITVSKIANS